MSRRTEPGRGRTLLVSGMVASVPRQGGAAWAVLQWVRGLRELGFRVVLVDAVRSAGPGTLPRLRRSFARMVRDADIEDAALLVEDTGETAGLPLAELRRAARRAAGLVNLAGTLRHPALLEPPPVRLYVDLDPGFTQAWHAQGSDMNLAGHTHHATVGLEIGRDSCPVPDLDIAWLTTLPPVALDHWTPAQGSGRAYTTVAHWRSHGTVAIDGTTYGPKAHSWRAIADLPRRVAPPLAPALAIHADERDDLALLRDGGWTIIDADRVAHSLGRYRRFVRASRGEIGVAKHGYVASRCGWFSDRSACYLASSRPVVAQRTGFERHLPTGDGLLSFADVAEAAVAIEAIEREYTRHAVAARRVAEEHLDARRVLASLLRRVGLA